ncbi:aspartic peptidase domain-containing protein [Amylostereum chailletii]|nr:aspartic peptidase domain-containing protein [Amylostereum chailletii]
MRPSVALSTVVLAVVVAHDVSGVSGLHISIHGHTRGYLASNPFHGVAKRAHISGLKNEDDVQYTTNITLNNKEFSALIDTGSSDLWVAGTVPSAQDTGTTSSVTYAVGNAEGPVKTASLNFAGYTVPDQAFLQVTPSKQNPENQGVIGLGPNSGSSIHSSLKGDSSGDTVIDRIFRQNTSTPNFISVLLGRSDDPDDRYPGDITVGEVLSGYDAISAQPHLPVTLLSGFNAGNQHWQVLLDEDGIIGPDGQPVNFTTGNKKQATAIFDTGFSFPQVPRAVANAFYARLEGAKFDSDAGYWSLPCDVEANITFKLGGQAYPIHPLDSNYVDHTENGKDFCAGAFQPAIASAQSDEFDIILGMAFLRNAYLLINYGDFVDGTTTTADPYVQLLSTTNDTSEAHRDFVQVRLNGVDTTGNQKLGPPSLVDNSTSTSTSNTSTNSDRNDAENFFERHRLPIIIAASVGGGLLLLLILSAAICGGRRRRYGQVYVQQGPYRSLGAAAPIGETAHVAGYNAGTPYSNPWDHRY